MEISRDLINQVAILKVETKTNLTEEQLQVIYRFNDSMSVFANPGTGKTTTAVVGLLAAQSILGIKGKKINTMSFTKLATLEISSRYKAACKLANVIPKVNFNTFHSLCFKILQKVYPTFDKTSEANIERELNNFKAFLKEEGVEKWDNSYFAKEVYKAMNTLNSRLLFSKNSVESSSFFRGLKGDIDIRQFQKVRDRWLKRNFTSQNISRGDLPLMALFVLLLHPEFVNDFKNEFELMVVDEYQDMSTLYLEVLALVSKKLIVIGDLKQQIFGFNGSSMKILDAYKEMYPDAPTLELTQSFRCPDSITEYANRVIAPNKIDGYLNFKGIGAGGSVTELVNTPHMFDSIVNDIKVQQEKRKQADVMFLARNNSSVVPVIEHLYKKGIVFRSSKFVQVKDLPIFKDLCIMADVARNSKDVSKVANINRFFPEFKWVTPSRNAVLDIMKESPRESDKDLLTMNITFNQDSSYTIINKLRRFIELDQNQKQPFSVSCQPLFDIYSEYVIGDNWWKLEQSADYYFNLVSSITTTKTYDEMMTEEQDKEEKSRYYNSMNEGVRCYTFHSAKGLEADKVILLDVDDSVVPKNSSIEHLVQIGCDLEAAVDLRNERNLLYVAITRCKKDLLVVHNGDLSTLIVSPDSNKYTFLDKVIEEDVGQGNETTAFKLLVGIMR